MQLESILRAIENVKLDKPSSDYVDIQVIDLETLYEEIKHLRNLVSTQKDTIKTMDERISILNDLAKMNIKPTRLNQYC